MWVPGQQYFYSRETNTKVWNNFWAFNFSSVGLVSKALVVFTPRGALWFTEGVSFKIQTAVYFSRKFPCLQECKHSSQPEIPPTCISDHECHENSWVSSLSKQLKAVSSQECSPYQPIPWQNGGNFCLENALSLFEEKYVRGRGLGVNGDVGRRLWVESRANGFFWSMF